MTPELAGELQRETGALEVARAYVVDSPEMAKSANDELRAVKARVVRLKELKSGFVAPAKEIISNAEALFDPAITALLEAETFLKSSLISYDQEQKRLADEARRKREEEERRARQEAERKAAAERAKAEEIAKEEHRKAEAAEEARRKAEAEGNAKAAAKAAAERAAAQERERQAVENGETRAQQLELEAAARPASTPAAESAPKLEGFSTRENWVAEIDDGMTEDQAKNKIIGAIALGGRTDLAALLKLDMSAACRLAKAQKRDMSVPGLVSRNRPVAASRG